MWVYVSNGLVESVGGLPTNWGNISNLPALPNDILIGYGWYPLEITPFTGTSTDKQGGMTYDIQVDKVVGTYEVVPKTPSEIQDEVDVYTKSLVDAVQIFMDDTAKTRNYDGILSLCTYATSTNPKFLSEGQAGVVWRDAVWAKCYQVMEEYYLGERSIPTVESLLNEIPVFSWGE